MEYFLSVSFSIELKEKWIIFLKFGELMENQIILEIFVILHSIFWIHWPTYFPTTLTFALRKMVVVSSFWKFWFLFQIGPCHNSYGGKQKFFGKSPIWWKVVRNQFRCKSFRILEARDATGLVVNLGLIWTVVARPIFSFAVLCNFYKIKFQVVGFSTYWLLPLIDFAELNLYKYINIIV